MAHALRNDPRALHVIITTDEPSWRGAPDQLQVARAIDMGGVLITRNRTQRAQFRRDVEAERAKRRPDGLMDPATTSVLLLPRHASTSTADARLLLHTTLLIEWYLTLPVPKPPTLVWNDAQQALIGGWRPDGYSAEDVRVALGQAPPSAHPRDM